MLSITPKDRPYGVSFIEGVGGVVVAEWANEPILWAGNGTIYSHAHRDAFLKAFTAAAAKIGWKRDKRCNCGWRKISK